MYHPTQGRPVVSHRPSHRRVKGLAALAVVAVAITVGVKAFADDDTRAEVVRVIDGDTLVARVDGNDTTIRLLNIDTPETKDPSKPVQCLGPEASAFLAERLPAGTEIELGYDEERTDRYGRTLAGVYESDSLINVEIAAAGLGVPVLFEPNDRYLHEVRRASENAQREEKGLFSADTACSLPAQIAGFSATAEQLPAEVQGDPAAALDTATQSVLAIDGFVSVLDDGDLATLGNGVFRVPHMSYYLSDLRSDAMGARRVAENRRSGLSDQLAAFQASQRAESEASKKRQAAPVEPSARADRDNANRDAGSDGASKGPASSRSADSERPSRKKQTEETPSSNGSGSRAERRSNSPAPRPATTPAPAPTSEKEPSSSGDGRSTSSCTPYGPEIPYSDAGGYTGKRHGMPGGKTFRKCR